MSAALILANLGFTATAQTVNGKVLVKAWTSKGWAYERFDPQRLEEEITAWARGREPGK